MSINNINKMSKAGSEKNTGTLEAVKGEDPLQAHMETASTSVPLSPDTGRHQMPSSQSPISNKNLSHSPAHSASFVAIPCRSDAREIYFIRQNSKKEVTGSPMATSPPQNIPGSHRRGHTPSERSASGSEINFPASDTGGMANGRISNGSSKDMSNDSSLKTRQAMVLAQHRIRTESQRSVVSTTAAEKGIISTKPSLRSMKDTMFDSTSAIRYGSSRFGSGKQFGNSNLKMSGSNESCQTINYVVEAPSVLPSLSSVFSIEEFAPPNPQDWLDQNEDELADPGQVSSSVGENMQHLDIFDDPGYTDTVKSNDSVGSLLRRSLSVPNEYIRGPRTSKRHVAEIFEDFFVHGDKKEDLNLSDNIPQNANNIEQKGKWMQTMEDLIEYPDYVDSLESNSSKTGLLARHAKFIAVGEKPQLTPSEDLLDENKIEEFKQSEKVQCIKNLLVLSVSFAFLFTAYLSLRNIVSSLYHEGGLGMYALSVVYASVFIGCIFATTIIQKLRPKKTMILCFSAIVIYMLANFYPSFYTIIPTACLVGFALSNLWTAHATYLTNIAATYAECTNTKVGDVLSTFNGVFYLFFQMSQLLGGVITSVILTSEPTHHDIGESNETYTELENISDHGVALYGQCGSKYCHMHAVDEVRVHIAKSTHYMLIGIYVGSAGIGLLLLLIFLDRLEGKMQKSHKTIGTQLAAVFKFFIDRRVLMLSGLMFYSLLQISFMFGEFTKAFVTCAMGLRMVGYTMVCMSACAAISSFCAGRLNQHIGTLALFIIAGVIDLTLLLVMLFWQPTPDTAMPLIFILAGAWGIGDGIYITQTVSLFGVLFSDNKEPAFAALKMCQALGACMMFVVGPYLCTEVKIFILIGLLVYAISGYVALDVTQRRALKAKPTYVINEISITAVSKDKVAV